MFLLYLFHEFQWGTVQQMIYVVDKNMTVIKTKLSTSMDIIADWLEYNGLGIKFNKGKKESLPFGMSQRIAKQNESLVVMYRGSKIMNTTHRGPVTRGWGPCPPLFTDINFSVGKMYDAEWFCMSDTSATRSNDFS